MKITSAGRCRIPLYYELKLVFILWLILPGTRGAQVLYKDVVYPLLHEYASKFDPTFSSDNKVRTPSSSLVPSSKTLTWWQGADWYTRALVQAPPEMHAELFRQAQAFVGKQGSSKDGFSMDGIFGKMLGGQ